MTLIANKYLFAFTLAVSAALAGCGGGDEAVTSISPEAIRATMQAQAQAPLPERQSAVSPTDAATQFMNFAEGRFPTLFPASSSSGNRTLGPFLFRFYTQTNLYLAVATQTGDGAVAGNVYVLSAFAGSRPIDVGPLTNFITPVETTVTAPVVTNKTLVITGTVSVSGQTVAIPATSIANIPAPTSQTEFCGGLTSNTNYSQIFAQYAGTLTIHNCSFSGNVGTISATITSTSLPFPVGFVATYTFQ